MSKLAPDLFQRRFEDLMEIGRARLPSLAPEWTDYNAHDPGITLIELLAWVAEAQLYSISRTRRDERVAYAGLLGISPRGTKGARGSIWPDRTDPDSPAATFSNSIVLTEETVINTNDAGGPTFRPERRLLWSPGRVTKLATRAATGSMTDHTSTNERGGLPFFPFGGNAGLRDVLALTFECRDSSGLFGKDRSGAAGACWPIGVIAAPLLGGAAAAGSSATDEPSRSPLRAILVTDQDRIDVTVASDTTKGFLSSGVILLDLDRVRSSPRQFTIELYSPTGFSRPPRVLRVEPNVIPILQGQTITQQSDESRGLPDWEFVLSDPGLRYGNGEEPVKLEIADGGGLALWQRCDAFSDRGPDENVYEIDVVTGTITFGNGVNGRIPPAGSQAVVTFSVSDGEEGHVPRNRKWRVAGFAGVFGVNPDPITDGAGIPGLVEDRREARRRSRNDRALVSAEDIAKAARDLPLLEVARAWVPAPPDGAPRTGVVNLVAMRSRPSADEPEQVPETDRWLNAIRRTLSPRMPLGSRLAVTAPRYVEFTISVVLEVHPGREPSAVKETVEKELRKRLALVESAGSTPRQAGSDVTQRDVGAWLRAMDGVARVVELEMRLLDGTTVDEVVVPRNGLPRCLFGRNTIEVRRATRRRSQ